MSEEKQVGQPAETKPADKKVIDVKSNFRPSEFILVLAVLTVLAGFFARFGWALAGRVLERLQ